MMAPATTPAGHFDGLNASHEALNEPREALDESDVALDARTLRAVEQARRESLSRPPASRDGRRCDFSMAVVALPSGVNARVASARQERGVRRDELGADAVSDPGAEVGRGWRRLLERHAADMLHQVRLEPDTLRRLLQVVGVLLFQQQEGRADKVAVRSSLEDTTSLHTAAASVSVKGPMARSILRELHRVACAMGEDVYERVRALMQRSVARGALSLDANAVRLESLFKLELRRHVTVDSVLERMADASTSILNAGQASAAAASSSGGAAGSNTPARNRARSAPPASTMKRERASSAHAFKMKALERILDAEWGRRTKRVGGDTDRRDSVATAGALEADEAALVHDKVTGFLYHRSRENFPFWREPPGNSLSREETARVLRLAISGLLGSPMFCAGLSVEHLLEMLRCMKWKTLQRGQCACREGHPIDELLLLVEGTVATTRSSNDAVRPDSRSDGVDDNAGERAQGDPATINPDPADTSGDAPPDSVLVASPACIGELGMVRPGERWTFTLTATSSVSLLGLTRQMFEVQLTRIFAGGKPKDAFALASPPPPQAAYPQPPTERPVSSPAMFAGGRRRTQTASAMTSPVNTVKVEEQLARAHRHREEALLVGTATGTVTCDAGMSDTPPLAEREEMLSPDGNQSDQGAAASEQPMAAAKKTKSPFQYYPTFSQRSDESSATGNVTSLFRLKWAQPIAFEMQSDLEAVRDEWAPPFPDTGAFIDYLAPSSTSATRMLFDKPNLLSMASLQAVCRHHPFLDGAYVLGADRRRIPSSAPSSPAKAGMSDADDVDAGDAMLASALAMATASGDQRKAEELSLAQFSEARKKTLQGRSNSMTLRSTPSARGLALSPAVSGRKASLEPFAGSTFVLESSFQVGGTVARPAERGIPEQLSDGSDLDSGGDSDDDDGDQLNALHDPRGSSPHRRKTSVIDLALASQDAPDDEASATIARKKTLDGLLQTGSHAIHMNKVVAAESAKQAIIRRHLQATAEQKSPPDRAQRERSRTLQPQSEVADQPAPDDPPVNSHAPLPLRVDLQKRMDSVLSTLRMRARAKLALVLKYTHTDHYDRFPLAVMLWEQALRYVNRREEVLAALRAFELVASDPRRHFRSLSTNRLQEQKERDALFGRLNTTTALCREALEELRARCGDDVFLDDRLYRDKMQKDYTEMLFEVEQERLHAIYRGVKPGCYPAETDSDERCRGAGDASEVAPAQTELKASGEDSRSTKKGVASLHVRIPPVRRELPPPSKSPRRSTVWRAMTTGCDPSISSSSSSSNNNNQAESAPTSVVVVEGGDAAASIARYALQTPQESLYISIGDQLLREQELAREEQQQRAAAESDKGFEGVDMGLKTPLPAAKPTGARGTMSHRMAARVQAQRQAELEALAKRLAPSQPDTPRSETPRRRQVAVPAGKASEEVRASESTDAAQDDKSALRQLLRAFVAKN